MNKQEESNETDFPAVKEINDRFDLFLRLLYFSTAWTGEQSKCSIILIIMIIIIMMSESQNCENFSLMLENCCPVKRFRH